MKLAVLSGKGGTGKTTVSTNLAIVCRVNYIDCDVEEPNGFVFLAPQIFSTKEVYVEVPQINQELCSLCGKCAKVCQFYALAKAGKEIIQFETLCHSCGACGYVCEYGALTYHKRSIGVIEQGKSKEIGCIRGVLNIGEPMAVPVIKQVLQDLPKEDCIIDCPPGTSCNVVNAVRYADAAVLVTEPSEFGLHDLKMAIEVVTLYGLPYGVIVNKDDGTNHIVNEYCSQNNIPILGRIPFSKQAAAAYSNGRMLSEADPYQTHFLQIKEVLREVFAWN